MAWGRGRAVSRLTPPPVPVPGGYSCYVNGPGDRIRHVLHDYTPDSLAALGKTLTGYREEIKIAGPVPLLREALSPDWSLDDNGHLMAVAFARQPIEAPAGYRVQVAVIGELLVAAAYDADGNQAASARLGQTGEFGVFDKVITEPEHRRRGLGTAIMRALTDRALDLGMTHGILVGSDEGRGLYESIGWSYVSDFPGARRTTAVA